MKKRSFMIAVLAATAIVQTVRADKETVDGIEWEYTVNYNEEAVSIGNGTSPAISAATPGDITVPSSLGDRPVRYIAREAFFKCTNLTSITLPTSVVSIGQGAMSCCAKITSFTIPNGVTSIGFCSFADNDELTTVFIPESVVAMGEYAFSGCPKLASIIIPDSVKVIDKWTFKNCIGLTSVSIPDSVTSIAMSAFYGCTNLAYIRIPKSVTSIGEYAFFRCSRMKSVVIPAGVTRIDTMAFVQSGLEDIYFSGEPPAFLSENAFPLQCVIHYPVEHRYAWEAWLAGAGLVGKAEDSTVNPPVDPIDPDPVSPLNGTVGVRILSSTGKAVLTATPDVGYVLAGWFRYGEFVSCGAKLTVGAEDAAKYVPYFRAKAGVATPVFGDDPADSLAGVAGVAFSCAVPVTAESLPVRFSATRLPAGLKIDADTGRITGVPMKAGSFTATVKATSAVNRSLSATRTLVFNVESLAGLGWVAGTYSGSIVDEDAGLYGAATLTLQKSGRSTGKFTLCGTNWTFSAASLASVSRDAGMDAVESLRLEATARAGRLARTVMLTICAPEDGVLLDAAAEGSLEGVGEISMVRSVWNDAGTAEILAPYLGYYTVTLDGDPSGIGSGYLTATVAKTGLVRVSGKAPDGTAVSGLFPMRPSRDGDALETYLCLAPTLWKGGTLAGVLRFAQDEDAGCVVSGDELRWRNCAPTATEVHGEPLVADLSAYGAYYDKAANLADYYRRLTFLPVYAPGMAVEQRVTDWSDDDRKETYSQTIDSDVADLLCWNSLSMELDAKKGAFIVPKATKPIQDKESGEWMYEGDNDAAVTFSFTKATGVFRGTFLCWHDYLSAVDYTTGKETWEHKSRTIDYTGVAVLGATVLQGHYTVPCVSEYVDARTGRTRRYTFRRSMPIVLGVE